MKEKSLSSIYSDHLIIQKAIKTLRNTANELENIKSWFDSEQE